MLHFGLRQLEHFVAVAEAGNYREAADRIGIAQPALSVSIRKLEEALAARLLDRGVHGAVLTPAGRAFLAEARRSLQHAERGMHSARLAATGEWGVLRLGFVGSAAYGLLPAHLPAYLAGHPAVKLELMEGQTVRLVEMVRDGLLDAAIVRMPVDDALALRSAEVERDDLVAVVPVRHALAGRRRIRLAELSQDPFILFSQEWVPGLRAVVLEACRHAGFAPRLAQEAIQAVTLVALVGSGLGVGLVPSVVARFANAQVRFVPLADPGARGCLATALVVPRDATSAVAARFFETFARGASQAARLFHLRSRSSV